MICEICGVKKGRTGGHFNKHIQDIHNLNGYPEYLLKVKYNGVRPLCKCGCGLETAYLNGDFNSYCHGHSSVKNDDGFEDNEEYKLVRDLYTTGKLVKDICVLTNLTEYRVYNILKKFKVTKTNSEAKRLYNIDDSIFENIDTEEKAYWLGFLFADGYNNTDNGSVTLGLSNYDYDILVKFTNFLKTNKKIRRNNDTSSKVVIENRKISSDLNKHGMVKKKTHILKFPKIDEKLERHFIRGYFDGDGCITYGKIIGVSATVSIVSTKDFLDKINEKININFSYTKRHKDRDDNILTITTGGIRNILYFFDYIYQDSTIYMDRKHRKFIEWFDFYIENMKIKDKTKEIIKKINYKNI